MTGGEWLKPDSLVKLDVQSVMLVACPWDCGAAIVDVEKHVAFHDDYRALIAKHERLVQKTCKHSWSGPDYIGAEFCTRCEIDRREAP